MEVNQVYQIYEILEEVNIQQKRKAICKNIRKYRLELYNKYKEKYKRVGPDNPYSVFNISGYLEISESHYKRIENENDSFNFVSINNLIKLSYILNKKIDDFLNSN